jgi:hypothetical protein
MYCVPKRGHNPYLKIYVLIYAGPVEAGKKDQFFHSRF